MISQLVSYILLLIAVYFGLELIPLTLQHNTFQSLILLLSRLSIIESM
jgi:hypothetical protein